MSKLNESKKLKASDTQLQDYGIENAIIKIMLYDTNSHVFIERLQTEYFSQQRNQLIFQAMKEMYASNLPIDIISVSHKLTKIKKLDDVGGYFGLVSIDENDYIFNEKNFDVWVKMLYELYVKRSVNKFSMNMYEKSIDWDIDPFDLIEETNKEILNLTVSLSTNKFDKLGDLIVQEIIDIEKRGKTVGTMGIPTGFTKLNKLTNGWQKSDLIIIAARPSMGKTAASLTFVHHASVVHNKSIGFFSLEMSKQQLLQRLMSIETEIYLEKIKNGKLNVGELSELTLKLDKLKNAPLYVDDTPALTLFELRSRARRMQKEFGLDMLVIDYLQLMSGSGSKMENNRENEISNISRGLKGLAKELNIPVIALSQLSRAVETRGGARRPMLSDLRESGSIEQDADIVMFLYRPEYYGIDMDEEGNSTQGIGEFIISKHRNGGLDTIKTYFKGEFTKFADMDFIPEYTPPTQDNSSSFKPLKNNIEPDHELMF